MPGPLRESDLLPAGPLTRLGRRVYLFEQVVSTNAFLLDAADAPDGAVAWAEHQTAGRGRLGRRWEAARGSSILLSVRLIEPESSPLLQQAGLLAALAAVEAVEQQTDVNASVRWPNDIAVQRRKLGGVLAESRGVPGAGRVLVIGIGLNCLQHAGHFPPELRDKATSLEIASRRPIDRAAVAAALLRRLDAHLAAGAWRSGALAAAWRARCGDMGTTARLQHNGRVVAGTILDIDAVGNLLVQSEDGTRSCFESATTTRLWE